MDIQKAEKLKIVSCNGCINKEWENESCWYCKDGLGNRDFSKYKKKDK